MKCKLRCDNFKKILDCTRAFGPAFGVTGISDEWYRSTMGVIVIRLRTPQSARENVWCTWDYLGVPVTRLGAPTTSLGAPTTTLEVQTTRLGSTWEHLKSLWSILCKATSFLAMVLVRLEIIATTYCSMIFKTHVFSLYSHLSIYIATHLHTVYLDWLQVLLESNSRCAWKCQSSELTNKLQGRDRASVEMHLAGVIECIWRYTSRLWLSDLTDARWDHDRASL